LQLGNRGIPTRCFNFLLGNNANCAPWSQAELVPALLLLPAIPEDIDLGIEVLFQAVFKIDTFSLGVRRNTEVQ
jgi:hypothetical protein